MVKLKLKNWDRDSNEFSVLGIINRNLVNSPEKNTFAEVYSNGFLLAFQINGILEVRDENRFLQQSHESGYEYENAERWHYIVMTKFGDTLEFLIKTKVLKVD